MLFHYPDADYRSDNCGVALLLNMGDAFDLRLDYLCSDEKERLTNFSSLSRKRQFIASRALLKSLIAHQLGLNAPRIAIDSQGKPHIPEYNLACSISHSHTAILVGYSRFPIGVDIEYNRDKDRGNLVDNYFSPEEIKYYRKLPPEERQRWFYSQWTRKEATAKSRGEGISAGTLGRNTPSNYLTAFQVGHYSAAVYSKVPANYWFASTNNQKIELSPMPEHILTHP